MSASLSDFHDVLGPGDDDRIVDIRRLREFAIHGIPASVREEVWLYFLGVLPGDKTTHADHRAKLREHYNSLDKRIKSIAVRGALADTLARFHPDEPSVRRPEVSRMIRNVIGAFLNHKRASFAPSLLHLVGPLATVVKDEYMLYNALDSLLDRIATLDSIEQRCAEFLALFRSQSQDVFSHLEDQELNNRFWVPGWLQGMLAQELPFDAVLELWDFYLSNEMGFAAHPFVCIAIINKCKEDLEELEYLDLKAYFQRLPRLDITEILIVSDNVRRTTAHLL